MALKRILIKGSPLRDEATAAGAITPGHLVAASAGSVDVHGVAGGSAAPVFALEREMVGDGIDVAYAANDTVLLAYCRQGDMINALVAAGAGAIVAGDILESAGDGTLQVVATDAATDDTERESVVAIAEEAVDNSMGGSAVRIQVRIV